MTPAQLAAIGVTIRANPLFFQNGTAVYASDDVVSEYFNAPAEPEVLIWRKTVSGQDIVSAVSAEEVSALSGAKMNVWMGYLNAGVDATQTNVRHGLRTVVFGESSQSWLALLALLRRPATRLEAMFSTAADEGRVTELDGARLNPGDIPTALGY